MEEELDLWGTTTTSFFPAKPFGCYGDGGAIFTSNNETAALIDSIRFGKGWRNMTMLELNKPGLILFRQQLN